MKTLILVSLLILSACSANHHLRRSEHHLKKAIAIGAVIKADTVFKFVEIEVPAVSYDTVFRSEERDTVFISKDRLKIKYVRLPGDSVFIEGKCEADTIIKRIPITVTKEIRPEKGFWFYLPWILVLLVALILFYVFKR